MNACALGRVLKKSVAWVAGQYLRYIIRPTKETQNIVDTLKSGVFDPNRNRTNSSTVVIHLRGGHVDWGRTVVPLHHYMEALKIKEKKLLNEGRPITTVYLVSVDNKESFHNVSYMNEHFPGNFEYKILPRFQLGDLKDEFENALKYNQNFSSMSRAPFVYEFLADLQLMVEADCFIGSVSSIYLITTFLRYTKLDAYKNKDCNCYLSDGRELICENNPNKMDHYRRYFFDRYNAFTGGTPF